MVVPLLRTIARTARLISTLNPITVTVKMPCRCHRHGFVVNGALKCVHLRLNSAFVGWLAG